jgi:alkylation response protein AidB-like acyl-CoA dehydrogenase
MEGAPAVSTSRTVDPELPVDLVEQARKVAPLVRGSAAEVEASGSLTADVVEALAERGLFWIGTSAELGGADATAVDTVRVIEEVTAADTATGWSLMVNMDLVGFVMSRCEDAALEILYADGKPIIAGSLARIGAGVLTQTDDELRLNGSFQFASGSAYATWFVAGAMLGEQPVAVLVPREHVERTGNWDVLGLRGTGSQDFTVTDYVVRPELIVDPVAPARRGPVMHRLQLLQLGPLFHAGIALGIGRRAFEELYATVQIEAAKKGKTPLTEQSHFMYEFVRLEAAYRASRAYCLELAAEAERVAESGEAASDLLVGRLYQATAHATGIARDAVEFAYTWSGTRALREPSTLAQLLRDVHGVTQHMIVGPPVVLNAAGPVLESYASV